MYDVAIVGGGIAGSICAMKHAAEGFDTVFYEKSSQPHHKLCGEFLSGEVVTLLSPSGIADRLTGAGAVHLSEVRIASIKGDVLDSRLPGSPLGISRYRLDDLLRKAAINAGAKLVPAEVSAIDRTKSGYAITYGSGTDEARIAFGAFGRRTKLDRVLDREHLKSTSPYLAFKIHARMNNADNRINLFAFDGGYCGISAIEGEKVNVCWITHIDAFKAAGGSPANMIESTLSTNPLFSDYLQKMDFEGEKFYSSNQLSFTSKPCVENGIIMIGDASGMIAPLCGDGMAMAIDSALLASESSIDYLRGTITQTEMFEKYRSQRHDRYRSRMVLGRMLHHSLTRPMVASLGIRVLKKMPAATRALVRYTRG